jgi:hypothetical protein
MRPLLHLTQHSEQSAAPHGMSVWRIRRASNCKQHNTTPRTHSSSFIRIASTHPPIHHLPFFFFLFIVLLLPGAADPSSETVDEAAPAPAPSPAEGGAGGGGFMGETRAGEESSASLNQASLLTAGATQRALASFFSSLGGGWSTQKREPLQHSTAQHSTAQARTAQHSTTQHRIAQHSSAHHSTWQRITA